MDASTSPNALELFRAEHRSLRSLLRNAHRRTGTTGVLPPENDLALHGALPELRRRLSRYCRLEDEFLHAPLSALEPPPPAVTEARARCEIVRQMLERLELLRTQDGTEAEFRTAFAALSEHALLQFDTTQATLFPLARQHGLDLVELGERMRQVPQELADEAPAATRAADGRLDIGTAEDRNPPL